MTNKEAIILLREIKEKFTGNCTIDTLVPISRCDIQAIDLAIKALEEKPQGKWELHGKRYYCSECGEEAINLESEPDVYSSSYCLTNYCPNCGADMRGEINEV